MYRFQRLLKPPTRVMELLMAIVAVGTTIVALAAQPPVALGSAGTFAILSKTGVTDVYASAMAGSIGSNPITGAAILVTCTEVTGTIFAVDAAGPLPAAVNAAPFLTSAVGDMEAAYLDAAGKTPPDFTEVGAGKLCG